ncbi:lysozyme inhibitor LprI family protein [Planktomarina temperata]|nr:lysozyme inhibitor LprI family protein [Planktomarina temperata]
MKIINVIAALMLSVCGTYASAVSITDAEVRELRNRLVADLLPNCVGVESFYDQVYCSSKIYFVFDETLNEAYSDLRKELPSAIFEELRNVQRVWVKKRDDKCARLDGDAVIMDLQCAIKMTATSLWYLFEIEERPLASSELIADYKDFTAN